MGDRATTVVAAGAILNKARSHVLLSFRHLHLDQGGLWEYPGGKLESNESPLCALSRELEEELGISPAQTSALSVVFHDYTHKRVELHFFVVESYTGEPTALEGQAIEWCTVEKLSSVEFPEANRGVAKQLQQWLLSN